MKILSFNTYSATTMPYRRSRRRFLLDKITQWNDEGIDIVCLQEQNSHKIGFFSWLLYKMFNCRCLDFTSAGEGLCCPIFTYDNEQHIKDHIEDHNLDYKYIYSSPKPKYFMNSGLMILSKTPFTIDSYADLSSDFVHTPGLLSVSNEEYQISNCHLVPILDNNACTYTLVNSINKLCCNNVGDIQKRNIDTLCSKLNKTKKVVLVGDMNIDKEDKSGNYDYLIDQSQLTDSSKLDVHPTIHYNCDKVKQIDYILLSDFGSDGEHTFTVRHDCTHISDHHPIMLTIED